MFHFPNIQTQRLTLRTLTSKDASAVYQHFSDETVTRYMDTGPCKNIGEAQKIIEFHQKDIGCRWGLFDKASQQLVGTCGYHCWEDGQHPKAEIGYDLAYAQWGKGLMQEALRPVIAFGFNSMRLNFIEASVSPQNRRSIRLLETLGFQQAFAEKDLLWFHLHKDSWNSDAPTFSP